MVEQDKSMAAMIQNDDEKAWMTPLLQLRDSLDIGNDRHLRDFRRMDGRVHLFHDSTVPGPYTQTARAEWLRRLLNAQAQIRATGPAEVSEIELITDEELREIRRIWLEDKHEFEDLAPEIYRSELGKDFPLKTSDEGRVLGAAELELLKELSPNEPFLFEMIRNLVDTEWRFQSRSRRQGLYEELEKVIRKSFYESEEDAIERARNVFEARHGVPHSQNGEGKP